MKPPFVIGQKVRLNDYGFGEIILRGMQEFKDSQNLTVIGIENIGHKDNPIWAIDVDKSCVNKFLLESRMFDLL